MKSLILTIKTYVKTYRLFFIILTAFFCMCSIFATMLWWQSMTGFSLKEYVRNSEKYISNLEKEMEKIESKSYVNQNMHSEEDDVRLENLQRAIKKSEEAVEKLEKLYQDGTKVDYSQYDILQYDTYQSKLYSIAYPLALSWFIKEDSFAQKTILSVGVSEDGLDYSEFDWSLILHKSVVAYRWKGAFFPVVLSINCCLFCIIYLLLSQFKYNRRKNREVLLTLPFTKRQWFITETIVGFMVAIVIPNIVAWTTVSFYLGTENSFLSMMIAMGKSILAASCFYFFTVAVKESFRNKFFGTILGMITFYLLQLLGYAWINNDLKLCFLPIYWVILFDALFIVMGYMQADKWELTQEHSVQNVIVRLLIPAIPTALYVVGVLIYNLRLKNNVWYVLALVGISFGIYIALYAMLDVFYIAKMLQLRLKKR